MIQLDDAGWGCLLGGVVIGALRPPDQYVWGEVPVESFQGQAFIEKRYLKEGGEVAGRLLDELGAKTDERVDCCTGYVLGGARSALSDRGYNVWPATIGDPLQTLVESTLQDRLAALGLHVDYETLTTKQGLLFWRCLEWLKGGNVDARCALAARERQAKSGWSTYRIWTEHPYAEARVLAAEHKRQKARNRWRDE
jgi:hypothetical protein